MVDEKDLEQFKTTFIQGYINTSLDRLLDLRNAVKNATTYEAIKAIMEAEQTTMRKLYGINEKVEDVNTASKKD